MLFGGERAENILTQSLLPDVIDEIAHHPDIHIGFKQSQTHLAQRVLHVAFGDAVLASELFETAFESIAQSVEHDWELTMVSRLASACCFKIRTGYSPDNRG